MRYLAGSRSLQVSLFFSILLHIAIFAYLHSPQVFVKRESIPISVDFIPPPREEAGAEKPFPTQAAAKTGAVPKLKAGKPGAPPPMGIPEPRESVKEAEVPPPPAVSEEGTAKTEAHPLEVPKTPSYPGIKEIIPSIDQLARTGGEGEGGEGGKDEETVSLDSADFKYTSYLYGVKFKIEGVWRYPEAAKKSALQGRGLVSFTIQRDGTLSDLKLLTSSGYPVLDEAILNAIRAAAPFNPMAENMRVKRLNVVATFEYNLFVPGRIWKRY